MVQAGILAGAPGGGGGGGYHADAVHFDGANTYLSNAGLTNPDSRYFSWSFWFNIPSVGTPVGTVELWVVDPNGGYRTYGGIDGQDPTVIGWRFGNVGGTASFSASFTVPFTRDAWHHVLGAVDTGLAAGLKVVSVYLDNVAVTPTDVTDESDAFDVAANGLPFYVGDDSFGDGFVGDMADYRVVPGVNLLTGASIASGTRALFIDPLTLKPVNPSVATAALGAAGAVLFSGNAATFGTNQGTGGVFVTTGTLTNASTSPSDPTGPIVSSVLASGGNGNMGPGDTFTVDGGNNDAAGVVDTITPTQIGPFTVTAVYPGGPVAITAVVQGAHTFAVSGDFSTVTATGIEFQLVMSTGNNGVYTIASSAFALGTTVITVEEAIPSAIADGSINLSGVATVSGDHVAAFAGITAATINGSTNNDGNFEVQAAILRSGSTDAYTGVNGAFVSTTADGTLVSLGVVATYHLTAAGTAYQTAAGVTTTTTSGWGGGITLDITV